MSADTHLSVIHRAMLDVESGIAPELTEERGVWSLVIGRQLPAGFSRRQKRLGSGLLFTVHRPNGETSFSFRPDTPDKPGHKYEQPSKYYGGPGNVLDIPPSLHRFIDDTSVPVIFVEGIKKADSVATAARAAGATVLVVAISGVWNFLSDGRPIPDMLSIPFEGREAAIAFDSDVLTNLGVQGGCCRLAEHLLDRGADVQVAYLPDQPDGAKMGADDFLVSGKTYADLRMTMRAYAPGDFELVRMTRDEQLRTTVGGLWRIWRDYDWMRFVGTGKKGNWQRGHTVRDVVESLIELAPRHGKLDATGVLVSASHRQLVEMSAKSRPSVAAALKHAEADGLIEILEAEGEGKARSYRLLTTSATLYHNGEKATLKEKATDELQVCTLSGKGLRYPTAPRLRWSSPGRARPKEFEVVPGTTRVRHTSRLPRNPVGEDFEARPYVKRLGPHKGAVLDALEAASGELHLKDLCEVLHRERPWDVRRRILKELEEAGVIECVGDIVKLAADWVARLEEEREDKGEISQAEAQREKHREQIARYREHLERLRRGTPEASLAAACRSKDLRDRRLKEIREEEERDRAPTPPPVEALLAKILAQHGRMRVGLLCEIAREEGLRWRDVAPAVRRMGFRVERLPEFGDQEFVFAKRGAA